MIQKLYNQAAAGLVPLLVLLTISVPVQAESPILLTLIKASQSVVQVESENTQMGLRADLHSKNRVSTAKYIRTGTGIIVDATGIIHKITQWNIT